MAISFNPLRKRYWHAPAVVMYSGAIRIIPRRQGIAKR